MTAIVAGSRKPVRSGRNMLLVCAFSFLLCRCATKPPVAELKLVDPKEERLILLEERLERQETQIEKLGMAYLAVSRRLAKTLKGQPAEKKATAKAGRATLAPEVMMDEEPGEETLPIEGETVADSRHESMQWYFDGLRLMEARQYERAAKLFERFVRENPGHVYADRAQAQVAQCYAMNKDYGLAVVASNILESRYPHSVRLPEILLLRAKAYSDMGQAISAKATLRDLIKRYPGEKVAQQASRRLAELQASPRPAAPRLPERQTNQTAN